MTIVFVLFSFFYGEDGLGRWQRNSVQLNPPRFLEPSWWSIENVLVGFAKKKKNQQHSWQHFTREIGDVLRKWKDEWIKIFRSVLQWFKTCFHFLKVSSRKAILKTLIVDLRLFIYNSGSINVKAEKVIVWLSLLRFHYNKLNPCNIQILCW